MDDIEIGYFLEDRAQEGFIRALVERIASEQGISTSMLKHNLLSARGGSKVLYELKRFSEDYAKTNKPYFDILIVSIDGNCKGYNERVTELNKCLKALVKAAYPKDNIIYCVPDPHIERWYLFDPGALQQAVGTKIALQAPAYKCRKEYYKSILRNALKEAGVDSLLGGPEYAEEIVRNVRDLDSLQEHNAGFGHFVNTLRKGLQRLK